MASLVKAIDEMHGGYSVELLTNGGTKEDDDTTTGGSASSVLSDLYIPYGLYYQNDRAEFTFHKPQKAGTIDNKLFDYLLDAVSKNRSKPTRKITSGDTSDSTARDTKKTRKH